MEFGGLEWDNGNREKCQRHGVTIAEIEEIFARPVLIINDPHDAQTERRFRAIGTTTQGRKLFVVFTWRGQKIRPLSARYMHQREISRYDQDNSDV